MKHLSLALLALCLLAALSFTACKGTEGGTETESSTLSESVADTVVSTDTEPVQTAADTQAATELPTETPTEAPTQPEAAKENPVITLSSADTLTVKAGETVKLPTFTAVDPANNGKDITSWVEVTDSVENNAIQGGEFCGKIAGDHTVYYFVETADGRIGEAFLTVKVQAATTSSFDVKDCNSLDRMTAYKEFREDLEKGKKAPMLEGFESSGTLYLSSADNAIEGTSLIFDTDGGGLSGRFYSFSDYFHRDEQTTYRVTFSYKLLEASDNFSDFYFGLIWDGTNGLNRNFIPKDAEVGKTYTCTLEYSSVTVPSGVNAAFFMFKLNPATSTLRIAFDNFIIETVQLKQVKTYVPTVAELSREGGFTWDYKNNYATCENSVLLDTASLPEEIRTAIEGQPGFGSEVLKASDTEGHAFAGLNTGNMPLDKTLVWDMDYYCVNDTRLYLIMLGAAGNRTQKTERTENGNLVHLHMEVPVTDVWDRLNLYVQNNAAFEIYIGSITVALK